MLFNSVVLNLGVMLLHASFTSATPVTLQPRVPCDKVSRYSIKYFLDNKIREPEPATCLFYTAYLSGTAKRFAHSGGAHMTTIWDMWSCDHYDPDLVNENNRLRCIFKDDDTRKEYFSHMSEAMAVSCDNFATVMTDDPKKIPQDGIWGTVEQPALKRTGNPGGRVDTIIAVDKSGGNVQNVWTRPPVKTGSTSPSVPAKQKRDEEGVNRCYTPEQIQEAFGSVPW